MKEAEEREESERGRFSRRGSGFFLPISTVRLLSIKNASQPYAIPPLQPPLLSITINFLPFVVISSVCSDLPTLPLFPPLSSFAPLLHLHCPSSAQLFSRHPTPHPYAQPSFPPLLSTTQRSPRSSLSPLDAILLDLRSFSTPLPRPGLLPAASSPAATTLLLPGRIHRWVSFERAWSLDLPVLVVVVAPSRSEKSFRVCRDERKDQGGDSCW